MAMPNINGGWLSKNGQLVYTITQLNDKFVWRVVHKNGVTETGVGWFTSPKEEKEEYEVKAQWNFHGGNLKAKIENCSGVVENYKNKEGKVTKIRWKDWDHFTRVPEK